MKGIILTELIDLIETRYSPRIADAVLAPAGLLSAGVYTAVGNYDYEEFVELVARFARVTQQTPDAVLRELGRHTFKKFMRQYPQFVVGDSAFELLARVDDTIHATLANVHPDAELPKLRFEALDAGRARIEYRSERAMADYAEGAIHGCIAHFDESIDVAREDLAGAPGTHACFTLTKTTRR